MTERYAHLAPEHLHDALANLGFSTQFQHTEKPTLAMDYQNGLVTVINGRGERIRTSGPCLPKAVLYQAELHPDVEIERYVAAKLI